MITYITKHGETLANKQKITQGHKDSPLTEKGKNSANNKGLKLKNIGIKYIYTSDLGRALTTSKIINKYLKVKITKIKYLRERNFGSFNGKKHIEIEKKLNLNNKNQIAPNGESFNQMKYRVLKFIESLKSKNQTILIVTHDGPIRAVLTKYSNNALTKDKNPKDRIYKIKLQEQKHLLKTH